MMFKKITIVGFGLIGSSIAREIKKHKLSKFVSACDISSKHLTEIKKLKLADEVTPNLKQSMIGSDLIIISTPLSAYKEIFVTIKKFANKPIKDRNIQPTIDLLFIFSILLLNFLNLRKCPYE